MSVRKKERGEHGEWDRASGVGHRNQKSEMKSKITRESF